MLFSKLLSTVAITIARSETLPFDIKTLFPLRRCPPFFLSRVVLIFAGFDPTSGSVIQKHGIKSPAQIPGKYLFFIFTFSISDRSLAATSWIKKIPVSDLKQGPSADEIKKEREDNEKWLAQYEKDKSAQDAQRKADQEKWDEISKMLANADPKKLKMSWEDFSNIK